MRMLLVGLALQFAIGGYATARDAAPPLPSQVYGALFERVQAEKIFPDG